MDAQLTHALALLTTGIYVLTVSDGERRQAAARRPDNLEAVPHRVGGSGLPILDAALACLECRVIATHAAGDHSLFVARVEQATVLQGGEPLTSLDLDYVYVGTVVKRPR